MPLERRLRGQEKFGFAIPARFHTIAKSVNTVRAVYYLISSLTITNS